MRCQSTMENASQEISMTKEEGSAECSRKQPYKNLEFAVNRIVEVAIPLHLQTLREQLGVIENLHEQNKFISAIAVQVNASNTFRLLKADIHELENLNYLIRPEDADIFLQKIQTPTRDAIDALAEFSDFHPGIVQPLFNLHAEDEDITPLRCNELGETSVGGQQRQVVCNLTQSKIEEKSRIAKHWLKLKQDIIEVNELIHKFANLVFHQRDSVSSIEDNIASTKENVDCGTRHLSRAVLLKSASVPIAGAVIGGLIFGPVGAFVGFKLFGTAACAASGGILGYTVGHKLKKTKTSIEFEMKPLTAPLASSSSTSLPDLTAIDDTLSQK